MIFIHVVHFNFKAEMHNPWRYVLVMIFLLVKKMPQSGVGSMQGSNEDPHHARSPEISAKMCQI